jgi:hypothetical protein
MTPGGLATELWEKTQSEALVLSPRPTCWHTKLSVFRMAVVTAAFKKKKKSICVSVWVASRV